jgi:tripartite-type tricarboxylate transporter receptor subunit TctC
LGRLNAAEAAVLRQPDVAKRIQASGLDPMIGGPDMLAALLKAEVARAVEVVKDAGIQPE